MKKNKILLLAICTLLATVVGVSFAYFVVQIRQEGEGAGTTATPAELMKVEFDAGESALSAENMMPGDTGSKAFKVTVTPTTTENNAIYAIMLDITNNTFVKCDDTNYNEITNACTKNAEEIIYRLKDSSGKIVSTGDLTAKTGKITLLKESKTVSTSTDFNYTLEIEYVNTNRDQNHNKNKTLTANVVVEFTTLNVSQAADALIAKNEMVYEKGYRYEGTSPKNYITFNDEVWRIIGVFDVETDAGKTESLVKIIRDESIGYMSYDTYGDNGSNDWTQSDIKTILNGQYYNGEDINYTYRNPSNSKVSSNPTVSITGKSINDTARAMIQSVKWKLGGNRSIHAPASLIYYDERGTVGCATNQALIEWTGNIGMMYASDYGYGVDEASCSRTINMYDYIDTQSCYESNWLYKQYNEWTMTPSSETSFFVDYLTFPRLYVGWTNDKKEVRPTLYLKSNVKIIGGDGSINRPYTLLEEKEEIPSIGGEGDFPVELD